MTSILHRSEPLPEALQPHLGHHVTFDLYGCDVDRCSDEVRVEALMRQAAEAGGATVLGCYLHVYAPQGLSAVVVIAESHLTLHTWPEHGFAAIDLFTCGDSVDAAAVAAAIQEGLGATERVDVTDVRRGNRLPDGMRGSPVPRRFSDALEGCFGLSVAVDLFECETVEGLREAAEAVCSGARVHIERSGNRVYIDVFSRAVFEPRRLAEALVERSGAHRYRLHLAVRE